MLTARGAIALFFGLAAMLPIRSIGAEPSPGESFNVGPYFIYVPEGFFVLVRRGHEMGAFRLTSVTPEGSLGLGKSTYESYFQSDGSGSFTNKNVVRRTGNIDIKPMKGIHSFAWQPGKDRLHVGKWTFGCIANQLVNMTSGMSEEDEGFEFAPTSAQSIAEVDASNEKLRWFRFDPNGRVSVPVADLPK